jgi:hypothetical protein
VMGLDVFAARNPHIYLFKIKAAGLTYEPMDSLDLCRKRGIL